MTDDEDGIEDGDAPVEVPLEDSLDLHSFAPRDVPALVGTYLDDARQAGFAEVRIIHGRGVGVQRARVRSLVAKHPAVVAFSDAPPERGGWGATLVQLAPRSDLDD